MMNFNDDFYHPSHDDVAYEQIRYNIVHELNNMGLHSFAEDAKSCPNNNLECFQLLLRAVYILQVLKDKELKS